MRKHADFSDLLRVQWKCAAVIRLGIHSLIDLSRAMRKFVRAALVKAKKMRRTQHSCATLPRCRKNPPDPLLPLVSA
jgi:hypothetical protein